MSDTVLSILHANIFAYITYIAYISMKGSLLQFSLLYR